MKVRVGKHTLESLTSGMYLDSMVVYREYIQNAIDSIDDAIRDNIISPEQALVYIDIDKRKRSILIEDNGAGIGTDSAINTLLDIGNSSKSSSERRGFRGIGRLCGLAYSRKITFETSAYNENVKTIVTFDNARLQQMLLPGQYEDYDLEKTIISAVRIDSQPEDNDIHYFRVRLDGVSDKERILDWECVENYVCQVAPLPYNTECFSYSGQIEEHLISRKIPIGTYQVQLETPMGRKQLCKLYSNEFPVNLSNNRTDRLMGIGFEDIYDDSGELIAYLWYGKSNYLGSILDDRIKGLRFRKGNMLVGDKSTSNFAFKEERFNGWYQGEIFVIDNHIIPNGRRDDFEVNEAMENLMLKLSELGKQLSKDIRNTSQLRNNKKESIGVSSFRQMASGNILSDIPDKKPIINRNDPAHLLKEHVYPVLQIYCNEEQIKQIIAEIEKRLG